MIDGSSNHHRCILLRSRFRSRTCWAVRDRLLVNLWLLLALNRYFPSTQYHNHCLIGLVTAMDLLVNLIVLLPPNCPENIPNQFTHSGTGVARMTIYHPVPSHLSPYTVIQTLRHGPRWSLTNLNDGRLEILVPFVSTAVSSVPIAVPFLAYHLRKVTIPVVSLTVY